MLAQVGTNFILHLIGILLSCWQAHLHSSVTLDELVQTACLPTAELARRCNTHFDKWSKPDRLWMLPQKVQPAVLGQF